MKFAKVIVDIDAILLQENGVALGIKIGDIYPVVGESLHLIYKNKYLAVLLPGSCGLRLGDDKTTILYNVAALKEEFFEIVT